ncbi:DUF6279 family lipoprotein [Orrella marina]|uniref:Lipoprotein n=1 Tax=Orrella marina TaxID=2163011 RepID=A0A2R4XL65_9BURK|nr:DUF6279 family lipoprotein [Orrella marina]AWB34514.1 hypothetical protein DBV39_13230 [Orrella marina]
MRWISRLIAALLALIVAGCSSVQLAYNNAPFLLQYQLDRYLDLDDEQERVLRAQLVELQQWHKSHALPLYAQTLRGWAQTLSRARTFTAQEILDKQAVLQDEALAFGQKAAQLLGPVIVTLGPTQRDRLARRFETSNREYAQEFLNAPDQGRSERRERFVKNYERWLGPLSEEQLTLLDQWLDTHPNNPALWAAERQARQQALLNLIAEAPQFETPDEASLALNDYLISLTSYQTPTIQARQQERRIALAQLSAELLNIMTDTQRKHLQDELLSYAADFESLAGTTATSRKLSSP